MKPAPFAYRPAATLADACRLVGDAGAKPVAGSQSLGPMLNLRLARPSLLVDLGTLPDLRRVRETATGLVIGAAVTHAEIEDGEVPDPTPGWLRSAAANIAHRAVRNRGTLGGSLCHADPAADWVVVMTGLGAVVHIEGVNGARTLAMEDFITGPFATALGEGELLAGVEIARPGTGARWGYWKFSRQVGEFAKASAVVHADPERGIHRCAIGALGGPPAVLADAAAIIAGDIPPAEALARALPERDAGALTLHVTALARALAAAAAES